MKNDLAFAIHDYRAAGFWGKPMNPVYAALLRPAFARKFAGERMLAA